MCCCVATHFVCCCVAEDFMKKFDDMAARIRNVVLPDPATSNIHSDSDSDSGKTSLLAFSVAMRNS